MAIEWVNKADLYYKLMLKLKPAEIILDIGTGISPQEYIEPSVHICCEPYAEYIEVLKQRIKSEFKNKKQKYVLINLNWGEVINIFPKKSIDSVFLIDVIEHLNKEEASILLKRTEEIVTNQIVIFTPLGFMPQTHNDGKDAWGLSGAKWQEHLSGWDNNDFDESWDILAVKAYHFIDNIGNKLEEPFGALWAIKNYSDTTVITNNYKKYKAGLSRVRLHRWLDKFLNLFS